MLLLLHWYFEPKSNSVMDPWPDIGILLEAGPDIYDKREKDKCMVDTNHGHFLAREGLPWHWLPRVICSGGRWLNWTKHRGQQWTELPNPTEQVTDLPRLSDFKAGILGDTKC